MILEFSMSKWLIFGYFELFYTVSDLAVIELHSMPLNTIYWKVFTLNCIESHSALELFKLKEFRIFEIQMFNSKLSNASKLEAQTEIKKWIELWMI